MVNGMLKISQPDLVMGRRGAELRGIFWVEEAPESSYFILRLSSANKTLILELDSNKLSPVLLGAIEKALGAAPVFHESTRLFAEWDLSGFDVSRIGKAFGGEWENAVEQLVEAKSTVKDSSKVELDVPRGCGCGRV